MRLAYLQYAPYPWAPPRGTAPDSGGGLSETARVFALQNPRSLRSRLASSISLRSIF